MVGNILAFIYIIVLGMILSDVINGYSCERNGSMYLFVHGEIPCELINKGE